MNPGTILRLYSEGIGKIKWFVILENSPDCKFTLIAYINSHINPNVNRSERRVTLHLPLRKAEYPTLNRDSHLDCSTVYEVDLQIIARQVLDDPDGMKGRLSSISYDLAINMVKKSSHVERKLLKKYGLIDSE